MKNFKLSKEIISLSISQNWDKAKLEWKLSDIYFSDDFENCLCGHEIIECCVLTNSLNQNECIVGNVCVNKFMGIDSNKIFDAVKRVKKDLSKSLNSDALEYAHEKKWINDWEKDFYFDTLRKRKLSEKQATKRKQINQKVVHNIYVPNSNLNDGLIVIVQDWGRMNQYSFCEDEIWERIDRRKYKESKWIVAHSEEKHKEIELKAKDIGWHVKYVNLYG